MNQIEKDLIQHMEAFHYDAVEGLGFNANINTLQADFVRYWCLD